MRPTIGLNHNLLAVESDHTVQPWWSWPRPQRPRTEPLAEGDLLEDVSGAMAAAGYDASTQKGLHYEAHRNRGR
jgi:hypothetical protein